MAAKINVNDFDKIAAGLQALKAAAEAEGTEEAWQKYEFTRDGYDGPGVGVDYNEDTGKFTLGLKATSPMRTAGLLRETP